jgi:hypothetical protein
VLLGDTANSSAVQERCGNPLDQSLHRGTASLLLFAEARIEPGMDLGIDRAVVTGRRLIYGILQGPQHPELKCLYGTFRFGVRG